MTMDLEELRGFIAVVEAGSFLGAARALGVSRTTLRRQVGSLEARAGVALLEAARQGVAPTEAGQILVQHGRTMMQGASALLASIREVGHAPSGVLRVVLPVGLPPHTLVPVLGALRTAYPELYFNIRFSDDPLSEALVDVDLAVHFGNDPPKGPWVSYVVLRLREHLIASAAYLERRGTPRAIHELSQHELFAWQAPGEDPSLWRTREGATFRVRPSLVATDIHFIRSAVLGDLGIGFVPDALLPDPGHASALVPVMPDMVGGERPLRISVPAALSEIPKIKMILDHVRGMINEL